MKEIQIFLNLKLREWGLKQSGVRIAVITDATEAEAALTRQLSALGNVTVNVCTLGRLREYPYSVDEQADVVLSDIADFRAVEALLPDRRKLIPIAMSVDTAFMRSAMECVGMKIGVVCENEQWFHRVREFFPQSTAEGMRMLGKNEDASAFDVLIVPEGVQTGYSGRVIEFRYVIDEGSMLSLSERINRIRDERQVRPGIFDYE